MIDKTERFWLGLLNNEEVTRKISVGLYRESLCRFLAPQFPVPGDKKRYQSCLPSVPGRVTFPWKFYDLFQGRRAR